jgi:hypothetical protein
MPLYANARQFVSAVASRYRALSSYQDTGHVRSFRHPDYSTCNFSTAYRAPLDFRVKFSRPHPYRPLEHLTAHWVVGTQEGVPYFYSRLYSSEPRLDHPASLSDVISGATGVSSGAASPVAALIFGELENSSLLRLKRLRFRRSRSVEGTPCICVSGLHPARGRVSAYFGATDLLLRKLVYHRLRQAQVRHPAAVNLDVSSVHFGAPTDET